jgi:hypothetical protein
LCFLTRNYLIRHLSDLSGLGLNFEFIPRVKAL